MQTWDTELRDKYKKNHGMPIHLVFSLLVYGQGSQVLDAMQKKGLKRPLQTLMAELCDKIRK